MEYLTANEIAEKWGISPRRVTLLCKEGRVDGAFKKGFMWLIPSSTEKPSDPRRRKKVTGENSDKSDGELG